MYGDAYADAGWMLQIVAVGAWFQMLEGTLGATLLTLGQSRSLTVVNASRLIGVLVFVPGFYWLGQAIDVPWLQERLMVNGKVIEVPTGAFLGMLLGFVASDFLRYLTVVFMARRNGMSAVSSDVLMSLLILVITPAVAFGGAFVAGLLTPADTSRPVTVASTVGLMGSPLGEGPLVSASALFPGRVHALHPKIQALVQFACQGVLVVLVWGLLYRFWLGKRLRQARAAS
jgi:hypothetical protein